jgi:hypothetical protein
VRQPSLPKPKRRNYAPHACPLHVGCVESARCTLLCDAGGGRWLGHHPHPAV